MCSTASSQVRGKYIYDFIKFSLNFFINYTIFFIISSLADSEEKFYVLPKECSNCERLNVYKEILTSSEALKAKLDRCLKVCCFFDHINPLHPSISINILHTVLYIFLKSLQGEFVSQTTASLAGDHFLYSHYVTV